MIIAVRTKPVIIRWVFIAAIFWVSIIVTRAASWSFLPILSAVILGFALVR